MPGSSGKRQFRYNRWFYMPVLPALCMQGKDEDAEKGEDTKFHPFNVSHGPGGMH